MYLIFVIYVFRRSLFQTPWLILDASIFATILYWLTGLKSNLYTFLWSICTNVMVLILSNTRGKVKYRNFGLSLELSHAGGLIHEEHKNETY